MSQPIRNLGEVGIITDLNPYDLPPNAVSRGVNVRFQEGKIAKAPAFRRVFELIYDASAGDTIPPYDLTPSFLFDFKYPGSSDLINIVEDDGRIWQFINDDIAEVTQTGFSGTSADTPFTHTVFQGMSILNRSNMIPQVFHDADTEYDDLANWTSDHRCRALRAFKSYLIALDITKGATRYPTMIKWSDTGSYNTEPLWDETDPTLNAGENTPGDATSAWLDGLPLANQFFIYNDSQVFRLAETGTNDVFDFKLKFNNRGIINTNCVVEHDGVHYVFDSDDIYAHDGVQTRSICEGVVRKYIYQSIDLAAKDSFFVFKSPGKNTIHFCYKSADELVAFPDATKCNRAAVFDTVSKTWTFDDLPNAVGWAYANIDTFRTYEDVTTDYETTGGTYNEGSTGDSQHLFIGGLASTGDGLDSVLYGFDLIEGGILPYPVDETATMPAIAYRWGIDMDETGAEIQANKYLRDFFPQIDDFDGSGVTLKFAATMYTVQVPTWGTAQAFDPSSQYHLNPDVAGRYLGWYIACTALTDFRFSGFDFDAVTISMRT